MLKKILTGSCLALITMFSLSCAEDYLYNEQSFFAMNTFITIIGEDGTDFDGIEKLTLEYEARLSRTVSGSEISILNTYGQATVSDDTSELLSKALHVADVTDGAYNPCMGSIVSLWDITSGKEYIPSEDEISKALALTDYNLLSVDKNKALLLKEGIQADLGGIAKGYVLEKAVNLAQESGMRNICISFGGNVGVIGASKALKNSGKDGWNVGITNPFDNSNTLGSLVISDGFISVSGSYERFFEKDGKVYHHIFDPKTGKPAESDIACSAVITKDGALGDALSTALFVMGSKKAAEFYLGGQYEFDMILIKKDGEIIITDGIYSDFSLSDNSFTLTHLSK